MGVTDRLMAAGAVLELTALSQATLYGLMSEGRFPRPLRVGKRAVRWLESDIETWLQERIAERDQERETVTVG